MSDTTETVRRRLRDDTPVIDAVCRRLEHEFEGAERDLAVQFAEIFLARAPQELLRQRNEELLTGITRGAFRFLMNARPWRVDVSVFNPEVETEGWHLPVTVVQTNVSERPFIVDTIREFLHSEDLVVERMIYPILDVERDDEGRVTALGRPSDTGPKESLVHCEVGRITDPERLRWIETELARRLQDVVRATDDFAPMVDAINGVVADLAEASKTLAEQRSEIEEIQAFLRWLRDGGFVFLGYRAYDLVDHAGPGAGMGIVPPDGAADEARPAAVGGRSVVVEAGSGLGILRNEAESRFALPVALDELGPGMRDLAESGPLLIISKTNASSTVHRGARMDYIGVKKLGAGGRVVGEHRFIGLFTSRVYTEAAENIPILRRKLKRILEESGLRRGSHDYKEIITIFNSMPKEELFLTSAEEIGEDIRTILTSYNTEDVLVTLRNDPLKRGLSVMVILPKERFSGDVRRAIESALVAAFQGGVLNYHLTLGGGDQARLHFHMAASVERLPLVQAAQLEHVVAQLIRTWTDRLLEALEHVHPPDEARHLAHTYGQAFSPEYQAATEPEVAVRDVALLEAMLIDGRPVAIDLANRGEGALVAGVEGATELKVFLRGERLILSDFMPLLEDSGLRVMAVKPFEVGGNGTPEATIYVFAVQDSEGQLLDVEARGALLAESILAVRAGDALSDALNSLVVTAGLHWREIDVLRAYAAYAFQLGAVPSRLALPTALVRYPGIARELFDIFQIKFDPDRALSREERLAAVADVRAAFHGSLGGVSKLAEDRALRRLQELLVATVRTSYYSRGGASPNARSGGVPYTAYKFACAELEHCRRSRLLYEVWVHSSRMEGVHLRGSMVARGGIRWSDRPDDFRTEVQGLVRTQVVKNAVIVPGGSKGGFITRQVPDDPKERFAEGRRQYETLIRGLLDITDDLSAGKPATPAGVLAYDPPDPYLVVAADKGTSTFSDVANGISKEYGFWLQDAFASGGSHGYDHKAVGITARGGWESVKRHFREKGKDVQSEPFTVVGIGDMSGDVFGNAMLRSRRTRLVAAFDHRHVFIDPDPDPELSFVERERLFRLERSSWDDYDRAVLSPGGMIVPRGAKEVELTAEARQVLGLDAPDEEAEDVEPLDGESLIRAVLRAPVELLWNGGIGTYVKASTETSADAGDPSNDAVRVDASELRCEVVGEGGNLGFTQRARVEYALAGGRINTDALDNSGGVDMSDHEVNLKILLAPAVASGRITEERRNALLEELTDDVVQLVLEDNIAQSLAVSLDELRAQEAVDDFRDLMFTLEKAGELDRTAESLPSLDVLVERRERGQGLVRPELCVLLAYSKLSLKTRLLASGLPDDPVTESYLIGYFPPAATRAVGSADLASHRLRREIIASQLTNDLVDVMGATFVARLVRDTGRTAEQVARAWLVAARLADHRALVMQMAEQRGTLDAEDAYRWILGLSRVLERTTRWVLLNVEPDVSPASIVAQNLAGLATLRDAFADVVSGEERLLFEARVREIQGLGADESFSKRLITLRFLDQLLEILEIARETESEVMATAEAYYRASELLDVPWLRRSAFTAAGDDQWEHRAVQVLSEDISQAHRRIVIALMRGEVDPDRVRASTEGLFRGRAKELERYLGVVAELKKEPSVGIAAISVAARELSALADRVA